MSISTDCLTIINEDTVAYHSEKGTLLCTLKKLSAAALSLRSMIPNHPRIEHYYGMVASKMWILTENIISKTLRDAVEVIKIDITAIWKIILQIAEGMQHLHAHQIIHCRLSLDNIFFRYLEDGYETLIGNLDQAIKIEDQVSKIEDQVMKIEDQVLKIEDEALKIEDQVVKIEDQVVKIEDQVLKIDETATDAPKSKASDMWDFGVLIWQALHEGQLPTNTMTLEGLSPTVPEAIKSILIDCWKENPAERPIFDDAFLSRLRAVSFDSPSTSKWSYCTIA